MNLSAADIDAIVHRVLQQLQPPSAAAAAPELPTRVVKTAFGSDSAASPASLSVTITDRVITATVLEAAVTAGFVKSIQVPNSAIVTPAAKDWLKQRGVAIDRRTDASTSAASTASPTWLVLVSTMNTAAATALQMAGLSRVSTTGTALEAAAAAANSICRAEAPGVIVLTGTPDLVACRCNRQSACRAIAAVDAEQLIAAGQQWSPNIVAINPVRRGTMELRRLLQAVHGWNPAPDPRDAGV
jgi:hypothetical protein